MKRKAHLICLCLVALLLSACSERPTSYYPKYEDALKDGAVKRGWIPEIVPETATEIHEQHDIDTNDVWIRFTVSGSEKSRLIAGLKRLRDDEIIKQKLRYPSEASWWFEGLIQQSPADDNALNAEVYSAKCDEGRIGGLALDRTSHRVYYWCSSR